MNKYKSRYGRNRILTDNELAVYTQTVIFIASGFIVPVFPNSNNSNPSNVVCLNPVKDKVGNKSFIDMSQWIEVLSPVVERVSSIIGRLPTSSSPIDFRNVRIGFSAYNESGIGSLYVPTEDSLFDLVKKMIIQTAKEAGYGT
tara:strand:- start:372 stop:800 length:429 start_codon:yes stop_codon:yes gene_type:complete